MRYRRSKPTEVRNTMAVRAIKAFLSDMCEKPYLSSFICMCRCMHICAKVKKKEVVVLNLYQNLQELALYFKI